MVIFCVDYYYFLGLLFLYFCSFVLSLHLQIFTSEDQDNADEKDYTLAQIAIDNRQHLLTFNCCVWLTTLPKVILSLGFFVYGSNDLRTIFFHYTMN